MDSRQISEIRDTRYEIRNGSAIILAIVLTTLLAILGVLFLLSSRVDSVATSAVGDNEDLKLAVDTVVSQISQKLVLDTPGVDPNGTYYDYPDPCSNNDSWLACLEPYQYALNIYHWRHVTDIYNVFAASLASRDILADIVPEYQPTVGFGLLADADGDGVSDSIWVQVPGKMSAKGKPIYTAVRVIDNGGMLNINTAYKFDPNYSVGSTQLDINLMAFAALDHTHTQPPQIIDTRQDRLLSYRCGSESNNIGLYEQRVVWQYGLPAGAYTPFDISDELNLRNRYIINRSRATHTISRIETLWTNAFDGPPYVPRDTTIKDANWTWVTYNYYPFPCPDPCAYDNRHIATTYNCDRIINPAGQKMFNINSASAIDKYAVRDRIGEAVLAAGLNPAVYDANQIAANLIDYIDTDSNVTFIEVNDLNNPPIKHYFGFETPCIYISEIAQNFYKPDSSSPDYDANDPNRVYRSYAIELFKPYWQDDDQNGWYIETRDDISSLPKTTSIVWTGSRRFHVLANNNSAARIAIDFNEPNDANVIEPNAGEQVALDINFGPGTTITLYRDVNGYGRMPVDSLNVPDVCSGWMDQNSSIAVSHSFERDIASIHRCIRKVLSPTMTALPTIGYMNRFVATGTTMIQAHPANKPFTNVGEIGQLFRTDAYLTGPLNDEASVRLNIADPNVQSIFKYLTVIDPAPYTGDPNETRIKGRININAAPWFVLAQLPWVSSHTPNYDLARSIVNYRDTHGPFKNIGELMTDANSSINSIGYYEGNPIPSTLLTPSDGGSDLFELRDAIFTRISNLITVRSDVFTAYILVRIGPSGPQKRVIAILDRSGVTPTSGKVKIVAIQPVPDAR